MCVAITFRNAKTPKIASVVAVKTAGIGNDAPLVAAALVNGDADRRLGLGGIPRGMGGSFILDDDLLLTGNAMIRAPDGLARIWFSTEPTDYWPVTNTSLWLEWRLWSASPNGYHVTNLLLHIVDCWLIWWVLAKLSIPGPLAALLFAVHPINVESVAWIAQRKNVLALLFFLLAIGWYLNAESDQKPEDLANHRGLNLRWYGLSLTAFVLAMLSKGSVAILPLVLLLIAWWRRNKIARRDLLLTAPFFFVRRGVDGRQHLVPVARFGANDS